MASYQRVYGGLPVHREGVGGFLDAGLNLGPEVSPNVRFLENVTAVIPSGLSRNLGRFNRVSVVAIDAHDKGPPWKTSPGFFAPSVASKQRSFLFLLNPHHLENLVD
eukprot:3240630-Pyramimonas_sp.AAC.1